MHFLSFAIEKISHYIRIYCCLNLIQTAWIIETGGGEVNLKKNCNMKPFIAQKTN